MVAKGGIVASVSGRRPTAHVAISLWVEGARTDAPAAATFEALFRVAALADEIGLHAIWLRESRGPDNQAIGADPTVLAAGIAAFTTQIRLGGWLVAGLHDPVRIAEEWAVVDCLSGGRACIALGVGQGSTLTDETTGVLAFGSDSTADVVQTCGELWQGSSITRPDGLGRPFTFTITPRPIQSRPPIWRVVQPGIDALTRDYGAYRLLVGPTTRRDKTLVDLTIAEYRNICGDPKLADNRDYVTVALQTQAPWPEAFEEAMSYDASEIALCIDITRPLREIEREVRGIRTWGAGMFDHTHAQ